MSEIESHFLTAMDDVAERSRFANTLITSIQELPVMLADRRVIMRDPKHLGHATLVPFGAPALTDTQRILTSQINDHETDYPTLATALLTADIIDHQTRLPIGQKTFIRGLPTNAMRDRYGLLVDEITRKQEPTVQSLEAANSLHDILVHYSTDTEVMPLPTDIDDIRAELPTVKEMEEVLFSPLYFIHSDFGSPEVKQAFDTEYTSYFLAIARHPLASELLFNGEFSESPRLEYFTWQNLHTYATLGLQSHSDISIEQLDNYFFEQPAIQEAYWRQASHLLASRQYPSAEEFTSTDILPLAYPYINAERFFGQDQATIKAFLNTTGISDKDQAEKGSILRRLMDYAALFKTRNPDHANNELLIDQILALAERENSETAIRDLLAIISGEQTGIIYVDSGRTHPGSDVKTARIRSKSPKSGKTIDDITAGINPDSIHYVSSLPGRTVIDTEAVSQPEITHLALPTGEAVFIPHWQEVLEPSTDTVQGIVEHMQRGYASLTDSDTLFELVTSLQDSAISDRAAAVVIPELFPEQNPIHALSQAGIAGVQRKDTNVSIIIDSTTAAIATEGPKKILITGKLHEGNLNINGAPEDYDITSPLHLALTGAALMTQQETVSLNEGDEKGAKRKSETLSRAKKRITAGIPKITSSYPLESEPAVVYPIAQGQFSAFSFE